MNTRHTHISKRALVIALAVLMALLIIPFAIFADENESETESTENTYLFSGGGTSDNPYLISSLDDLKAFRDAVNSGNDFKNQYFKLTCDIDLKGSEDNQWTPIGNETHKFCGNFNGGGHTIKNLYINSSGDCVGFFGFTQKAGNQKTLITNFTIENATVNGDLQVGAFAGCPFTTEYSNITLKGYVYITGRSYVGGMFGKNLYANLTNAKIEVNAGSYVKVHEFWVNSYVGGVVGFMGEGNHGLKEVTSNIDVFGYVLGIGGIVGIAQYNNTLENITCTGNVSVDPYDEKIFEGNIGGIAGAWGNEKVDTTVTFTGCGFSGKVTVNEEDITATNAITGGVRFTDYTTTANSGSLIVNGEQQYPLVAQIGDTKYGSLSAAFAAAKSGDTIEIIDDIIITEQINITNPAALDGKLTIKGNGHTITSNFGKTDDVTDQTKSILYFGSVDTKTYCVGVTIENLTLKNANGTNARFGIMLYGGVSSTLTNVKIEGEYYYGLNLNGTHGATLTNCDIVKAFVNNATANPLTLKGTTIGKLLANIPLSGELGVKVYVADTDSTSVSSIKSLYCWGDSTLMIDSTAMTVVDESEISIEGVAPVAKINGVYYNSLNAAFAAAKTDDTIKLYANSELNEVIELIGKSVTLDLNGHTVSYSGATPNEAMITVKADAALTICDSSEEKSGKLCYTYTGEADYYATKGNYTIRNYGTLNVEGGTVEMVAAMTSTNAPEGKLYYHCVTAIDTYAGSELNISGGKFVSDFSSVRIFANSTTNGCIVNITGGEFECCVWLQYGRKLEMNISGGTFSNNPKAYAMAKCSVYLEDFTDSEDMLISISGGTYNAPIGCNATDLYEGCIIGGTFSKDAWDNTNSKLIAPATDYKENADETYTLKFNLKLLENATLSDAIYLNFRVPYYRVGTNNALTFTLTRGGETTTLEADVYEIDGEKYYKVTVEFAPHRLTEKIDISVSVGTGESVELKETCVADYCKKILNTTIEDKYHQLVVDLLYYGAEAQKYAGYNENEEDLATDYIPKESDFKQSENEINYEEEFTIADSTNTSLPSNTPDNTNYAYISGAGLYFGSQVKGYFIVTVSGNVENLNVYFVDNNGSEQPMNLEEYEGGYIVYTDGISAVDLLDTTWNIKLAYDSNHKSSETLTYSAMNYIAQYKNDELVKALYQYAYSAKNFAATNNTTEEAYPTY